MRVEELLNIVKYQRDLYNDKLPIVIQFPPFSGQSQDIEIRVECGKLIIEAK